MASGASSFLSLPRHEWRASLWILVSLLAAWLAPMPLLALGPVLLGVPHLTGDLRYLVPEAVRELIATSGCYAQAKR